MAKSVALRLAIFLVALVMAPMARSNSHTKEFTVFGFVITQGPSANFIPVAGNPNNPINTTKFGTMSVFGAPLRESINTNSPVIGQSQGINVINSLDGTQAYDSFALVFTAGEYKGSSLELQGSLRIAGITFKGEVALVGGTGSFRSASGYALIETLSLNPLTMDVVQKLQIYVKQDHN